MSQNLLYCRKIHGRRFLSGTGRRYGVIFEGKAGDIIMAKTIGIGTQNFESIMIHNDFYVDKTMFIREWWENRDVVTLITRPRRFVKTLLISMVERFFSIE